MIYQVKKKMISAFEHETIGYNFKFTEFQAAVGISQMKKLRKRIEIKKKMFRVYRELLKDVQNIDLMNLAGFCRNCLSRWYREEAEKKGISISDPDAREHIYGMPYSEWKEKYQK